MLGNDTDSKMVAAAKLPSDFKQLLRDIAFFIGMKRVATTDAPMRLAINQLVPPAKKNEQVLALQTSIGASRRARKALALELSFG